MPRLLPTSRLVNLPRLCLVGLICLATLGILSQPSLAQIDPIQQYDEIFGTPEEFLERFRDQATEDLNQFIGAGMAVSAFLLVIRAMFH